MTVRRVAVRLVIVAALLATVATSAPPRYELAADGQRILGSGAWRVHARVNRAGVAHANVLVLELDLVSGSGASVPVTIIPDDPELDPVDLMVGVTPVLPVYGLFGACSHDRECDAGVTIEVPAGATLDVHATVTLASEGGTGLCASSATPLPADATVDVAFEP